jgi:hypothetical protein
MYESGAQKSCIQKTNAIFSIYKMLCFYIIITKTICRINVKPLNQKRQHGYNKSMDINSNTNGSKKQLLLYECSQPNVRRTCTMGKRKRTNNDLQTKHIKLTIEYHEHH